MFPPPFGVCKHWGRRPWPRCVVDQPAPLALCGQRGSVCFGGAVQYQAGLVVDFALYILVMWSRGSLGEEKNGFGVICN
jgi:hypothetical protein